MRTRFVLTLGACGLATGLSLGADWPSFRGPNGNGVVDSTVPTEWAKDKNVA